MTKEENIESVLNALSKAMRKEEIFESKDAYAMRKEEISESVLNALSNTMNKEEIFESVLNALREDGFARVCPVCENDEEGDNCPVYGSCEEIDLGWWENKNLN